MKDKDLLLKYLCGRLLYGVKVKVSIEEVEYDAVVHGVYADETVLVEQSPDPNKVHRIDVAHVSEVKPYLFPLKTMTIEQRNEFYEMTQPHIIAYFEEGKLIGEEGEYRPITPVMMYPNMIEIDWLFKRHFDVFGLIEKGLAIDATKLNIYKEETK